MMPLVTSSNTGHWYKFNQKENRYEPCYEIDCTTTDGTRSPTVADARKLGLLYGVTTISNVFPKPNLKTWKENQIALSCLTLPRLEGESLDDFAHRAVADAEAQSKKARERGELIHRSIERYLVDGTIPDDDEWRALIEPVIQWVRKDVTKIIAVEEVVGDWMLGYAGRLDFRCILNGLFDEAECVIDFKTQDVKVDAKGQPKPMFWNDWPIQLAGYGHCVADTAWPRLISVIVGSKTPGLWVQEWTEPLEYWEDFQTCLRILKRSMKYDPTLTEAQIAQNPNRPSVVPSP